MGGEPRIRDRNGTLLRHGGGRRGAGPGGAVDPRAVGVCGGVGAGVPEDEAQDVLLIAGHFDQSWRPVAGAVEVENELAVQLDVHACEVVPLELPGPGKRSGAGERRREDALVVAVDFAAAGEDAALGRFVGDGDPGRVACGRPDEAVRVERDGERANAKVERKVARGVGRNPERPLVAVPRNAVRVAGERERVALGERLIVDEPLRPLLDPFGAEARRNRAGAGKRKPDVGSPLPDERGVLLDREDEIRSHAGGGDVAGARPARARILDAVRRHGLDDGSVDHGSPRDRMDARSRRRIAVRAFDRERKLDLLDENRNRARTVGGNRERRAGERDAGRVAGQGNVV